MEEVPNVRLVRCPKCENLLPELPDFSVYQCGGCGAVLRAKRRDPLEDRVLETSDEENNRRVSGQQDADMGLSSVSLPEMESSVFESGGVFKRNNNEKVVLNGSSSAGVDSTGVLEGLDGSRIGRERSFDVGVDQDRKARFTEEGHQLPSNGVNDSRARVDTNKYDLKSIRPEYVKLDTENKMEEVRPLGVSVRTRPDGDQRTVDKSNLIEPCVNPTSIAGPGRFTNFPNADVGSSNHVRGSHYRYGEGSDGLARVQNLENDRAELLRKLDELTSQLTRSCDTAENPRERAHPERGIPPLPPDAYGRHDSFKTGTTRFSYGVNNQILTPDKYVPRVPYASHNQVYGPYMDRHGIPFQEPYHLKNFAYEYGGFPDVYQAEMMSRPSYQPPNRCHQEPCYQHITGRPVDFNQDLLMSHSHETFFHQPACSCLHCISMNRQVSSKIQPSRMFSQHTPHDYINRDMYHQHVNHVTYDHLGYISERSNLAPLKSHDSKLITRSASDLDRETAGFGRSRLKNTVADNGGRQLLHPIAGAAPFVTCCNCFELLKLPRNLILFSKSQCKLKCGACSSILLLELDGKVIASSVPERSDQVFAKVASSDSDVVDENFQTSQPYQDTGVINNYDAFENFDYSFRPADPEPFLSSEDQKSNFGGSHLRQVHDTSTSGSSEDEQSPDTVIVRKETCVAVAEVSKNEMYLPVTDSPSQDYSDHYSDEVMHICGQGNVSKRIDPDRNSHDGKNFRQNSLKDSVMATETDVSYNDHLGLSHDSAETGKEEDIPRSNKGGESFFVGFFKRRGFGDFSRSSKSSESRKLQVSVNGLCLTDRVLKKAEKLAGPIQSGDYWYDVRAGFWGVMGHPCLGVIPPNIEEFNYPITANCSGGNTEIFVNGRELHQKDLDLLARRGLPTTRQKSYFLEISGRIVDEDTGEELEGLGKLAPTVERAKHGFGMKVPKSLRQQKH